MHARRGQHFRQARRRPVLRLAAAFVVVAAGSTVSVRPSGAVPQSISVSASGTNGTLVGTGSDCPPGQLDVTKHWTASGPISAGGFTAFPGQISLDMQFLTGTSSGALRGTDSRVTLQDARGSVELALVSGSCTQPTMSASANAISGSGTWSVIPSTSPANAYRNATGSGTFAMSAGVAPGNTNPWSISLSGSINGLDCTIDLRNAGGPQLIDGTDGAEIICGSPYPDIIQAMGGNDWIYGNGGADLVIAGDGNDAMFGGNGSDSLVGTPGRDSADGEGGIDICVASTTTNCEVPVAPAG